MAESVAKDFLDSFDESRYPDDFLLAYEALECLGHNEMGETLLVKDRQTDIYYVAKCYENNELSSPATESELLKGLHHTGLPEWIGEYRNDRMQCVVREFMEGNTLEGMVQDRSLELAQIISIGIQLCNILSYLHSQTPPIIHRDIKPQNIIMDKEGNVRLIDFGISRFYQEEAKNDTFCFGTMEFAPPEQYGFSQTDCRTDIFSLGVVLCWLMTGETDTKKAASKIVDKQFRYIIQKCVAFAPEKRYASAKKVKAALLRVSRQTHKKIIRWLFAILACSLIFCFGFAVGRYTDITSPLLIHSEVKFEEPLIEQAIRLALNKQEGDSITEEELLKVTELYIFGNRVAESQEEFDALGELMIQDDGSIYNGGIRSLQDMSGLKNIRKLNIALQNITDLAPLSELDQLEQIELKHNPIEDLSPLKAMPSLRQLYLFDTCISDLSVLADCPRLENLVVGKTNITSVTAFAGIKNLTYLYAEENTLETLAGIEEYTRLQEIGLTGVADGDLSPLLSLPQLKKVVLGEAMREEAQSIASKAGFEIIYRE